jgi:geranylgeranyl pyrophosphate synthase
MKTATASRLEVVRADINKLLKDYYEDRLARAGTLHHDYAALWRAMRHLGAQTGKRFRPYIMLVTYQGLGGRDYQAVLPVAAALELLHASMLIHDDIIDRDYVRYGRPNIAGQYRVRYAHVDSAQRDHYAAAAALVAGDLALSGAYELIMASSLPDQTKIAAQRVLAESIFAVGGGELLDSEAVLHPFEDVDSLTIARLKTASYSFVCPLVMGATLAGADTAMQLQLQEFGKAFGVAYQLSDDILGLYGDESVTGKPTTSDLEEGKRTYLMQRALQLSGPADKARLLEILAAGAVNPKQANRARRIIRHGGALEETRTLMGQYLAEAEEILNNLPLQADARAELTALMRHTATRQQ